MKRNRLLLGMLPVACLAIGCDDGDEPSNILSDQEAVELVLETIDKNEAVSAELFDILSDRIPADSIKEIRKQCKDKKQFIDEMTRQTTGYFDDVLESKMSALTVTSVPSPLKGEAESTLKGLAVKAEDASLIDAYADLILKEAKASAGGHDEWIALESISLGQSGSRPLPVESISLNFVKVEALATTPHKTIMNLSLKDEEVNEALGDFMIKHNIPPVAIGLLLPAVQKIQQSSSEDPFTAATLRWLDETVDPAISGGLDRDIIRRIQAAAFLASLHTLVSRDYPNDNQDNASLSLLKARYRAAVIVAAAAMWEES